ncbi:SPFH domain-containing protein [Patescibacteria group bacterium]
MKKKAALMFGLLVLLVFLLGACAPPETVEGANQPVNPDVDVTTTLDFTDDDVAWQWPDFLQVFALLGAGALFWFGNKDAITREGTIKWFNQIGWVVLLVVFVVTAGIIAVPVNTYATVRQTIPVSNIYAVGPGVSWAPPVVSRVNYYTTRVRSMTIENIQADSSSPGRPQVFPDVTIWFQLPITSETASVRGFSVNTSKLIELDLLFGPEYETAMLSKRAVTAVKEVVGQQAYDYLGNSRPEAQTSIQETLQDKIGDLVVITSVEVVNYSYTPEYEIKLDELSKKQIEEESAKRDKTIAENRRDVAEVNQETRNLEGQGEANYNIQIADAEAQRILLLAQAQAEAYQLIATQLRQNPDLLGYEYLQQWDGRLPYVLGNEDLIYDLPEFGPQPPSE